MLQHKASFYPESLKLFSKVSSIVMKNGCSGGGIPVISVSDYFSLTKDAGIRNSKFNSVYWIMSYSQSEKEQIIIEYNDGNFA